MARIVIKATRPDGVTMYWSESGWSGHASDAHDFRSHEAAGQAATWDRELRGMGRYGFAITIEEKPA